MGCTAEEISGREESRARTFCSTIVQTTLGLACSEQAIRVSKTVRRFA